MDPRLAEEIRPELNPHELIEAIVLLRDENQLPAGIKPVSRFGQIITCRVKRGDVREVYNQPELLSFKAARLLTSPPPPREDTESNLEAGILELDLSALNTASEATDLATGKGVVIGVIDWGGDFAHADFLKPDGSSRFLALWDQTQTANPKSPKPFGYGSHYGLAEINAALKTATPYKTLGYHPGKGGPHGTHVLGIAASSGISGVRGIAPEADIIFVHLGASDAPDIMNLGDSVNFLEAIDYIRQQAGQRPLVINASVGRHGGCHSGRSLVEQAMDYFLENRANTAICQSTGNYYSTNTHASGQVYPGKKEEVIFSTDKADLTPNELEVWYQPRDVFVAEVQHLESGITTRCKLNNQAELLDESELQVLGRIYHRSNDPTNGLNHINLFLYPSAPWGEWKITLWGEKVVDGRFHMWIERDGGCPSCQSRFRSDFTDQLTTTGTICNGYNTIVVGAINGSTQTLSKFSSSGPTLDGRTKPNILAPGEDIWAASVSPLIATKGGQKITRMSGTSMATPHVSGTVALMLSLIDGPIDIHSLRSLLLSSSTPLSTSPPDHLRSGSGILNIRATLEATKSFNETRHSAQSQSFSSFDTPRPATDAWQLSVSAGAEQAPLAAEEVPAPSPFYNQEPAFMPAENEEEMAEAALEACDGYAEAEARQLTSMAVPMSQNGH